MRIYESIFKHRQLTSQTLLKFRDC